MERLLMGLRTAEGVPLADLGDLALDGGRIEAMTGFLEVSDGRLIATSRGRPVLDHLLGELVRAA